MGQLTKQKKKVRMPVEYRTAIRSLYNCQHIDEAKTFTDAAEALAVWAKIYKHDEAGKQAKQLRLHAHRRMGKLAQKISPRKGTKNGGSTPGPIAELKSHGLTKHQADAANHLAKLKQKDFNDIVEQENPPAPTTVAKRYRHKKEEGFLDLLRSKKTTPFACRNYVARTDPGTIARALTEYERAQAVLQADALIMWLQKFNRESRKL